MGYLAFLFTNFGVGMHKLAWIILFFSALFSPISHAFQPESGWYWNPNESGRGFNIEIQDDKLFVAAFVYDASGTAKWYTAGGNVSASGIFSGQLSSVTNGQCIGCAYRAPTSESSPGNISIKFINSVDAQIVINNVGIDVTRFQFGIENRGHEVLYGEWATVIGSTQAPIYFGDRLTFINAYTNSGKTYAAGLRSGSSRLALAMVDGNYLYILLDSSSSYYQGFRIVMQGLNKFEGTNWTYLKTSSPSGSGLPVVGFRMAGKVGVTTGSAPTIKSLQATVKSDREDSFDKALAVKMLDEPQAINNTALFGAADALAFQRMTDLLEGK